MPCVSFLLMAAFSDARFANQMKSINIRFKAKRSVISGFMSLDSLTVLSARQHIA